MSQPVHESTKMAEIPGGEIRTGANPTLRYHGASLTPRPGHPPQSGQNHPPQGESGFVDGSGPLFSMYLQLAGEEDKKMTENWKGDAEGILIFVSRHFTCGALRTFTPRLKTGLFSAAVATLVAVSVQDLKPSSQDISAFYLANIYQILADSNGSRMLIPPTLPNPSIPFSPPTSAVWVNSLWFLSLVISLTCALLATLLQQWARRYMKVIQTRYAPHKRARIRAFFAEGVDKLHLPWAVEALPALLHLSLFLFFAGLAVFLFNINHTVFKVVISWVCLCTGVYMCITFMPIFRHDSPYYAPLSSSAWYLYTGTRVALFRVLWWIVNRCNFSNSIRQRMYELWWTYWGRASRGMEEEFEETARKAPPEIDGRALMWTYESLDEDHELEQFFSGIPGFCSSKLVYNPQSSLDGLRSPAVADAFNGFLERTWSSNLVSETVKTWRLAICIRAIDAAHLSEALYKILITFFEDRPALFRSVELGHSLISWGKNDDRKNTLFSQFIISCIIAEAPQRDGPWFSLTMHQLGISEQVLRGYLNHGDSVLLANLIGFTRQFVRNVFQSNWHEFLSSDVLLWQLRSNYNVQDTLPELQHDFCGLWNEIVRQRRDREHRLLSNVLVEIRPIYLALHQGSTHDQFPLCSVPGHHVHSPSKLNEVNDGKTVEMTHDTIITSPALLYRHAVSPVIQPVATNEAPTSPMPKLDHTFPHRADEPSRYEVPDMLQLSTRVTPSFHPSPLDDSEQVSDSTAAGPIQCTGQLALVPQFGHRPHMRPVGDGTPTMGLPVHESYPATIQSA